MHARLMLCRLVTGLWLGLSIATLAVVALSHVAPAVGYRVVIVSGGSMSPSIVVGSLLLERAPDRDGFVAGDVVTMEMPNGTTVTHRATRIVEIDGAPWLETRGDANAASDPALVPASAVSGVVAASVPFAGLLLAFLGMPTGAIAVLTALIALVLVSWLLEDGPGGQRGRAGRVEAADAPSA